MAGVRDSFVVTPVTATTASASTADPLPTKAAVAAPSHGNCKRGHAPGIPISHQDRGHETFFLFSFFFPKDLTFRRKFMGNPNNKQLPPSALSAGESYQAKKIDSLSETETDLERDFISL